MSSSERLKTATSLPSRWTWTRIPSSFHSTAAGLSFSIASVMSAAGEASIGRTGRPTWSRNAPSASAPPASAAWATAPRSPRSISARRSAVAGTPAAFAAASAITPSSAPWRSSPDSSARRKRCSRSVARPNRSASATRRAPCEPGPLSPPMCAQAASTSPTVSDGDAAGSGSSRSAAHPTPIWRWRSSPDRYATAIAASSGEASRSAPANASTFAPRALVAATVSETAARSASSTRQRRLQTRRDACLGQAILGEVPLLLQRLAQRAVAEEELPRDGVAVRRLHAACARTRDGPRTCGPCPRRGPAPAARSP